MVIQIARAAAIAATIEALRKMMMITIRGNRRRSSSSSSSTAQMVRCGCPRTLLSITGAGKSVAHSTSKKCRRQQQHWKALMTLAASVAQAAKLHPLSRQ